MTMHFNVADLFESVADAVPDRVAVVCGEKRLTFAELDARANRFAHALAAEGVKAGDHVGLYLYNSAEFLEAMLGAFKLRAVPININYRYVEEELHFLFSNADLVALVFPRELGGRVAGVLPRVEKLRTLVAVDDKSGVDRGQAKDYETLLAGASAARDFAPRTGDDQYIIYTGGTTGMPRGVMWRHEDVFFAGLQGGNPGGPPIERPEELSEIARQNSDPLTFLPAAPFIHGAAQWAALIGLFGGGKVVLVPGKSFDAAIAARLIEAERVNTMIMVGDAMASPLAQALEVAAGAKPVDTSSLVVIASAGAVLSDSVKEALGRVLPETMILNNFGATETGHQGTMYPGSGGKGLLSFGSDGTTTVLGEDLRPLAAGTGVMGKLARRGRIPLGYYKDPEKTAATFVTIDGERWVIPGDLATIEEDGKITVFGRGSVCINSGGEKIFPEEVEAAIKAHPDVVDAVVVGVPDERWGQRVAAVIQTRGGREVTLAAIDSHCRTKIAGYKVPRQLRLVDQIVRHPSGKPDYRWAAAAAKETPGAQPPPPPPASAPVREERP
jgi:acyl-CoA synthetase (AMP-forming)/AMP-acid ligase II